MIGVHASQEERTVLRRSLRLLRGIGVVPHKVGLLLLNVSGYGPWEQSAHHEGGCRPRAQQDRIDWRTWTYKLTYTCFDICVFVESESLRWRGDGLTDVRPRGGHLERCQVVEHERDGVDHRLCQQANATLKDSLARCLDSSLIYSMSPRPCDSFRANLNEDRVHPWADAHLVVHSAQAHHVRVESAPVVDIEGTEELHDPDEDLLDAQQQHRLLSMKTGREQKPGPTYLSFFLHVTLEKVLEQRAPVEEPCVEHIEEVHLIIKTSPNH